MLKSNVNIKKGKSKRIFYFDALRALAIISVILFHVFQNLSYVVVWDYSTIPSLNWFIADFLGTFFRCGVDLFLMLSGALSLGRVWEIKPFLAKRLPRIIYPFLLWGFVLTLVIFLISIFIPDAVSMFQQYKFGTFSSYDLNGFLQFLMNAYVAKARIWFRPYWFFWMILGTYLIMPIFNRWLLHWILIPSAIKILCRSHRYGSFRLLLKTHRKKNFQQCLLRNCVDYCSGNIDDICFISNVKARRNILLQQIFNIFSI